MAHRYFLSRTDGDFATVDGAEAAHLIKVMRVKAGDKLTLLDREGNDYRVTAQEVKDGKVICHIDSCRPNRAEPTVKLTVFMALPKADKLEFITQKMCELGAAKLIPFVSEYCVAQKSKKDGAKQQRLQKISDEACKQSGRGAPMLVEETATFKQVLDMISGFDKTLLFYEKGGIPLNESGVEKAESIAIIIGSEGGFSEKEARLMAEKGRTVIGLGKRILRCETAAVTAASIVMYRAGQLE